MKKAYGIVHIHSDCSLRDAAQSPYDIVKRAAEMGEPAVVLTDHGNLMGAFELKHAAQQVEKEIGVAVKVIPGIEAYFQLENDPLPRRHLVLVPKDGIGYHTIMKAVTESNNNIAAKKYPTMDSEILLRFFGPNSEGHGHVIATSACVGGVLSVPLRKNALIDHEIDKLCGKTAKKAIRSENDPEYLELHKTLTCLEQTITDMEKLEAEAKANRSKARIKTLTKSLQAFEPGSRDYEDVSVQLEKAREKQNAAEQWFSDGHSQLIKARKECRSVVSKIHAYDMEIQKSSEANKEIEKLSQSKISEEEIYRGAVQIAKSYQRVFGKENFFIELQYHGLAEESFVMPQLVKLAREVGAPLSAANDAHFTHNTTDDLRKFRLSRYLMFRHWSERDDDPQYYMKSAQEIAEWLSKIIPSETAVEALEGTEKIISMCGNIYADIGGTHYPQQRSYEGSSAEYFRKLAEVGIPRKYPGDKWTPELQQRLDYELSVIDNMGYSDYHIIVQDYVAYGRKLGVDNPEGVGIGIGPGRGSAVGSLACYLAGITNVDPIKHNLLFERFLNPERVSLPDIDIDFRTDIREKCIRYVEEKYGVISGIATKTVSAAKQSIRNAASALGSEKHGNNRVYLELGDSIARAADGKIPLKEQRDSLLAQFGTDPNAVQIISDAALYDGMKTAFGVHAAGIVISDCGNVGEYLPLMYNEEKAQWVCQATKEEVEDDAGLLKMDFLGLNNLNIITEALRLIKRNTGKSIDIENVGEDAEVIQRIFAAGNTDCVFQFESSGMKNVLTSFAPTSLEDIILLVAAYRPGPLEKIPLLVEVKHNRKRPDYIFPEMSEVLDTTYGYPIYQEQVQEIFHKFAGFSLGEADIVRRAMAKKKLKILTDPEKNYKGRFIDGMKSHGATQKSAEAFWEDMLAFANYAFNKSHAAAYAYIAYYTAWLKYYYPVEYMTAVLNNTDIKKIPAVIDNCRSMGITILPPDINVSQDGFSDSPETNSIRVGFSAIKGMGKRGALIVEARTAMSFSSVLDFISRTDVGEGLFSALTLAGAFDRWVLSRKSISANGKELFALSKKMMEKNLKMAELRTTEPSSDDPSYNKWKRKMDALKNDIQILRSQNLGFLSVGRKESNSERLSMEKTTMGFYVSGNPIDSYPGIKTKRSCTIADADEGKAVLCGIIENLEEKRRKKDNQPFATFSISDETGSIDAKCFVARYAQIRHKLVEGSVMAFKGTVRLFSNGDSSEIAFWVDDAETMVCINKILMVTVDSLTTWTDVIAPIVKKKYLSDNGDELVVYNQRTGRIMRNKKQILCVSPDILQESFPNAIVQEIDIETMR